MINGRRLFVLFIQCLTLFWAALDAWALSQQKPRTIRINTSRIGDARIVTIFGPISLRHAEIFRSIDENAYYWIHGSVLTCKIESAVIQRVMDFAIFIRFFSCRLIRTNNFVFCQTQLIDHWGWQMIAVSAHWAHFFLSCQKKPPLSMKSYLSVTAPT